jgi:TolB-like protein
MTGVSSFIAELKRRNVLRAGLLYLGAAWALAQGIAQLGPALGAPDWSTRWFLVAAAIGFPLWVAFAWFYEFTPQGLKRESDIAPGDSVAHSTGRKLDKWIIAVLALAVVLLLANTLVRHRGAGPEGMANAPARSIAVLPFDDLSPAHDRGYFSTGMAEELLNALARIPGLKVAGRASSSYYGSRNTDLRTIGEALNVANVLEGSVRSQGDAVRISVQMVRTADGFEVWSQSYDGDMHDIFDVQERIARAIASQLQVVLAGATEARLVPVATTNSEAYSKFLEAEALVNRRVGDSLPRAIALLEQATALDPGFARAWSKLAIAQAVLPQYVPGDWDASWQASDAAARRALAIDPGQAQAYAALSYNQFSQRHYVAMVEPMRRALALGPDDASVNYWAANELAAMGRTRDAEARIDAVLADDPANVLLLFYKSMLRWRSGDEAGALASIHRGGAAESPFGALTLGFLDAAHGNTRDAGRRFVESRSQMGTKIPVPALETIYLGTSGDNAQRQAALAMVAAYAADDWAPTMLLQLGEPARSFELYESNHSGLSDGYLNWLWQRESWSREARRDPAFQGFAQRIGMLEYWRRNEWPDLCKPSPPASSGSASTGFTCN